MPSPPLVETPRVNWLAFLVCLLTGHDDLREWSDPTRLRVRCAACGRLSAGVELPPARRRSAKRSAATRARKARPATIYAIEGKRARKEGGGGD